MEQYSVWLVDTAASWMRRRWGTAWNYVVGLAKDMVAAAAAVAVKARYPSTAPPDALPIMVTDSDIVPAYNEPIDVTRRRIRDRWRTAMSAGTVPGMLADLAAAGYPHAWIAERVGGDERWWTFRVTMAPPFPFDPAWIPKLKYDGGAVYDGGWTYVFAGPPAEDLRMLDIVRRRKPTRCHLLSISLVLDGAIYDDPNGYTYDGGLAYAEVGDGAVLEWS
jgi:hypothetical protein